MPKYIIERIIPGVSNFTPGQLKDMSKKSCEVIGRMGSQIQWLHTYVTGDKMYSVYIAPNAELIQEHARQGGDCCKCDQPGHCHHRPYYGRMTK